MSYKLSEIFFVYSYINFKTPDVVCLAQYIHCHRFTPRLCIDLDDLFGFFNQVLQFERRVALTEQFK